MSRAERQLGLSSEVLVVFDNYLHYPADRILFRKAPKNLASGIFYLPRILYEINKIRNKYDVFHFNFGTSPLDVWMVGLPLLDLPLYKGKIVVLFNGCDARQKYEVIKTRNFSACQDPTCYRGVCMSGRHDNVNRAKIKKWDRYAHAIFAISPDLKNFLPQRAQVLPVAIADWDEIETRPFTPVDKKLTIVHAPTNRGAKGSEIILDALSRLREKYPTRIEAILVENMSHSQAIAVYQKADLVIDQILIGWYGGLAVEVMKMGIPVMAYVCQEDLRFIPDEMARECMEAIINVTPHTVFDTLCTIVENPSLLKEYRDAGLDYINRWHDPKRLAGITKGVYEGRRTS